MATSYMMSSPPSTPRNASSRALASTPAVREAPTIRVCARFRPVSPAEAAAGASFCVESLTTDSVTIRDRGGVASSFTFDRVFSTEEGQGGVYEDVGRPVAQAVARGVNGTLIAYGQTGSGKTHTMLGDVGEGEEGEEGEEGGEGEGVMPRAVRELFAALPAAPELSHSLTVQFVEVYRERVRDLLDPRRDGLILGEQPGTGATFVRDAVVLPVLTAADVLDALAIGASNRCTAATGMNEASSRSHALFSLTLTTTDAGAGTTATSTLFMVDLAGSETVSRSAAAGGAAMEELKRINRGLLAMGQVITALSEGASHVPFRDSKLTHLLSNALGGNSRTTMLITCSPATLNAAETLSSLRFGRAAKRIPQRAVVNTEVRPGELRRRLGVAEARLGEALRREGEWLRAVGECVAGGRMPPWVEALVAAAEREAGAGVASPVAAIPLALSLPSPSPPLLPVSVPVPAKEAEAEADGDESASDSGSEEGEGEDELQARVDALTAQAETMRSLLVEARAEMGRLRAGGAGPPVVVEAVQRQRQLGEGEEWGRASLLPSDPPPWSGPDGPLHGGEAPALLPPARGWAWASGWTPSPTGWLHAPAFEGAGSGAPTPTARVRWRAWCRSRVRLAEGGPGVAALAAYTAACEAAVADAEARAAAAERELALAQARYDSLVGEQGEDGQGEGAESGGEEGQGEAAAPPSPRPTLSSPPHGRKGGFFRAMLTRLTLSPPPTSPRARVPPSPAPTPFSAPSEEALASFFAAAEAGDIAMVMALLDEGSVGLAARDAAGRPAIAYAARGGALDVLQEVARRGAALDAVDGEARTALMYACRRGHTGAAAWLLGQGCCDPLQVDVHGLTALHQAVLGRSTATVELLLQPTEGRPSPASLLAARDCNGTSPPELAGRFLSLAVPEEKLLLTCLRRAVAAAGEEGAGQLPAPA